MTSAPDDDPALIELAGRLFEMARSGDTATLVAYLDAGVPANLCNDNGDSLVMLAAYHGHAPAVAALLSRGADPNRPNDRGQTPIAGAVFKGEDDVVRALLDGGADPATGQPSAVDTAHLVGREDYLALFDGPRFDGPRFDGPRFDGPRFDGPRFDGTHTDGLRTEVHDRDCGPDREQDPG